MSTDSTRACTCTAPPRTPPLTGEISVTTGPSVSRSRTVWDTSVVLPAGSVAVTESVCGPVGRLATLMSTSTVQSVAPGLMHWLVERPRRSPTGCPATVRMMSVVWPARVCMSEKLSVTRTVTICSVPVSRVLGAGERMLTPGAVRSTVKERVSAAPLAALSLALSVRV